MKNNSKINEQLGSRNYSIFVIISFMAVLPLLYFKYAAQLYKLPDFDLSIYFFTLFPIGLIINLFTPQFGMMLTPFVSLILLRIGPLFFGSAGINVLFPLFLGASLGVFINLQVIRKGVHWNKSINSILLFFLVSFVLTWLRYSQLIGFDFSGQSVVYPKLTLKFYTHVYHHPALRFHFAAFLVLTLPLSLFYPLVYSNLIRSNFARDKIKKYILSGLLAGLLINILVVLVQSYYNLKFLSIGSGSALIGLRSAGLFSDSGASGVILPYFALLLILFLRIYKTSDWVNGKFTILLAVLFGFHIVLGKAQGRVYWLGLLPIILFFLLNTSFEIIRQRLKISEQDSLRYRVVSKLSNNNEKKERFLLSVFYVSIVLSALVFLFIIVILLSGSLSDLGSSFSWIKNTLNSILQVVSNFAGGNYSALQEFPEKILGYRYLQILFGLEQFYNSPLVGQGMNSFIIERFNPVFITQSLLDHPGSYYIALFSEYGIIGAAIILIWLYKNLFHKNDYKYVLILAGIPFLIGYHIVLHDVGAFFTLMLVPCFARLEEKDNTIIKLLLSLYVVVFILKWLV
jgi:hypothetical protein